MDIDTINESKPCPACGGTGFQVTPRRQIDQEREEDYDKMILNILQDLVTHCTCGHAIKNHKVRAPHGCLDTYCACTGIVRPTLKEIK